MFACCRVAAMWISRVNRAALISCAKVGGEHLEHHLASELDVLRHEDPRHASRLELALNTVAVTQGRLQLLAKRVAGHRRVAGGDGLRVPNVRFPWRTVQLSRHRLTPLVRTSHRKYLPLGRPMIQLLLELPCYDVSFSSFSRCPSPRNSPRPTAAPAAAPQAAAQAVPRAFTPTTGTRSPSSARRPCRRTASWWLSP